MDFCSYFWYLTLISTAGIGFRFYFWDSSAIPNTLVCISPLLLRFPQNFDRSYFHSIILQVILFSLSALFARFRPGVSRFVLVCPDFQISHDFDYSGVVVLVIVWFGLAVFVLVFADCVGCWGWCFNISLLSLFAKFRPGASRFVLVCLDFQVAHGSVIVCVGVFVIVWFGVVCPGLRRLRRLLRMVL